MRHALRRSVRGSAGDVGPKAAIPQCWSPRDASLTARLLASCDLEYQKLLRCFCVLEPLGCRRVDDAVMVADSAWHGCRSVHQLQLRTAGDQSVARWGHGGALQADVFDIAGGLQPLDRARSNNCQYARDSVQRAEPRLIHSHDPNVRTANICNNPSAIR